MDGTRLLSPNVMKRDRLLSRTPFERFRGALQHLDVVSSLIRSNEHEKARMAIILLHSLADGLMFWEAIGAFDHDSFLAKILPPKYSSSYRNKVFRYFDEKVEFCRKESKILSKPDATIFKIVNFYRNAAYHRDTHNPRVILPISRIAFHATVRLFEHTAGSSDGMSRVAMEGLSRSQASSIRKYCKGNGFIDYQKASNEAGARLVKRVPVLPRQVRAAFLEDLKERLRNLERMKTETLYCKDRKDLDELLKRAAFELKGIDDSLFAEIKELRYRILGKVPGGKPDRKHYQEAEDRYSRNVKKAFESFTPEYTPSTIEEIGKRVQLLQRTRTLESILDKYLDIDRILLEVEVLALHAERRIDESIQARIDIERGK